MIKFFGRYWDLELVVEMLEVEVDVDMVIFIGLIINELFINILKYVFLGG